MAMSSRKPCQRPRNDLMISESQTLALTAVERDPACHLLLGLREIIWSDLGPRATPGAYLNNAHRQRILLAVNAVHRVLPFWAKRYGDSQIPLTSLSTIQALMRGEQPNAKALYDQLWEAVIHLSIEQPFVEVAVGFAAVQALGTAMYDEFFDPTDLDQERKDGDDPESHDASYYASVAAAGGMPSDIHSSSERRLAFWRWWLTDGIELSMTARSSQGTH